MRKALSLALGSLAVPQPKMLDQDEEERRDQAKGTALVVAAFSATLGVVASALLMLG